MHASFATLFRASTSAAAVISATFAGAAHAQDKSAQTSAWEASRTIDDNATVSTGVAKARDPLNSATSTSALKERDITALAPVSLADLLRNVPGIRAEAGTGLAGNSYTVRGLPLVNAGSKYLQFQEDGLPVLEFGDFFVAPADFFLRADLNVAQIESIRGGSSSTFASNAPGGVVNLVSKTGDVQGGSVQASSGLDYGTHRLDADYGGDLGGGWRFHIGGFYRQGEGARHTGYDTVQGGQVKFNVTRQFSNGYVRLNAKLLDDQLPFYYLYPVAIGGTNAKPTFRDVPNFDLLSDSVESRYLTSRVGPGDNGSVLNGNLHDDERVKARSLGFEAQFTVGGWTLAERFRYADNSGVLNQLVPLTIGSATDLAQMVSGQTGATLSYATGPAKGAAINPATVNGNGLLLATGFYRAGINSMRNVTNDLRASRVWDVHGSALTTTFGVYKALQDLNTVEGITSALQDVIGGGRSALVDVRRTNGTLATQNGIIDYGFLGQPGLTRVADVRYDIAAPYASFNLVHGRLALGGSLRYDTGRVRGSANVDQGTRPQDMNADGRIDLTGPEAAVPYIDPNTRWPVNYNYQYLSYSTGINYRLAEKLSFFARYSRGARAGADSVIFSPSLNRATGYLANGKAAYDPVRQLEGGFKYRSGGILLNVTVFDAHTQETNSQIYDDGKGNQVLGIVQRAYHTYGAELETRVREGAFSVAGTMTLAGGKITAANDPMVVGKQPRHQAAVIYSITPQYDIDLLTVGVNVAGQTSSYAQDVNQLKMPGYTTVGTFVQLRPVERLVLALNTSNLLNARAFADISDASMPASGVTLGRVLPGRMVTASARVFF